MPRPNRTRTIDAEANVARRIAYERQKRGWTLEVLALRMTEAGCAIQPASLWKTEKAGRRITLNEFVALSKVFGILYGDLLLPPDAVADDDATRLYQEWSDAEAAMEAAWAAFTAHERRSVDVH